MYCNCSSFFSHHFQRPIGPQRRMKSRSGSEYWRRVVLVVRAPLSLTKLPLLLSATHCSLASHLTAQSNSKHASIRHNLRTSELKRRPRVDL